MAKLPPYLSFVRLEDDCLCVATDVRKIFLRSRLACDWIDLLSKTGQQDGAAAELRLRFPPAEVQSTFAMLVRRGFVLETSERIAPEPASLWTGMGLRISEARQRVGQCAIFVDAESAETTYAVGRALAAAGLEVVADIEDSDLVVTVVSDYLAKHLANVNGKRLKDMRRWIPVRPWGIVPLVGPVFRPGVGPCWGCLETELSRNLQIDAFLAQQTRGGIIQIAERGDLEGALFGLNFGALEISKAIASGFRTELTDSIVSLDLRGMEARRHRLGRRPQCSICGDRRLRDPGRQPANYTPILSEHKPIEPFPAGNLDELVSPLTGLVGSLEDVPSRLPGFYACHAVHNIDPAPTSYADLSKSFRHASGGKGLTAEQARTGALCEAIERYAGIYQGDEIRQKASFRELGTSALDPRTCMLFSDMQYQRRQALADPASAGFVPDRFDENAVMDWTPLQSVWHRERVFLPTALLYMFYTGGHEEQFVSTTNGMAAGRSFSDAFVRAFLELIERDCLSMWWYNRVQRPAAKVEGDRAAPVETLMQTLDQVGRKVHLLDITNDLGVPAVVAVEARQIADRVVVDLGTCADFHPCQAALGALLEFCQHVVPDGATDGRASVHPRVAPNWAYTLPHASALAAPAIDFGGRDPVAACRAVAERNGIQTYVLDCTRSDIRVPVARVIIPGLRHSWPRFAPGRLYDVPVNLGWLQRASTEADLNPAMPVQ